VKATRAVAYLLAGGALVLSLLAYMSYVYMLGFPDGFISELGRAQRRLAYIFTGISLALGGCFIYLGAVAPQKKIARSLAVVTALYSLVIIVVLLIDTYYRSSLTGSGGG
jgi:hypothetical protein